MHGSAQCIAVLMLAMVSSPAIAADRPGLAVTLLVAPDAEGTRDTGPWMAQRMRILLAALRDERQLELEITEGSADDLARCAAANEGKRSDCLRERLIAGPTDRAPVIVLVEEMSWRSAAQGVTCIGRVGGAPHATGIHLRDIGHGNPGVHASALARMARCLEDAATTGATPPF